MYEYTVLSEIEFVDKDGKHYKIGEDIAPMDVQANPDTDGENVLKSLKIADSYYTLSNTPVEAIQEITVGGTPIKGIRLQEDAYKLPDSSTSAAPQVIFPTPTRPDLLYEEYSKGKIYLTGENVGFLGLSKENYGCEPVLEYPGFLRSVCIGNYDGKFYLIGISAGYDTYEAQHVYEYDPKENVLRDYCPFPARSGLEGGYGSICLTYQDYIYIFGHSGFQDSDQFDVWKFSVKESKFTLIKTSDSYPEVKEGEYPLKLAIQGSGGIIGTKAYFPTFKGIVIFDFETEKFNSDFIPYPESLGTSFHPGNSYVHDNKLYIFGGTMGNNVSDTTLYTKIMRFDETKIDFAPGELPTEEYESYMDVPPIVCVHNQKLYLAIRRAADNKIVLYAYDISSGVLTDTNYIFPDEFSTREVNYHGFGYLPSQENTYVFGAQANLVTHPYIYKVFGKGVDYFIVPATEVSFNEVS